MKTYSNLTVCRKLIVLVKPLVPWMCAAVVAGVIGHLCAAAVPILGSAGILAVTGAWQGAGLYTVIALLAACAFSRGIFHYAEQLCNHYIAFKLLAVIRDRVFKALRRLCPAKLEGRDKGDLISLITSDIELLEVFYAHTLSPVAIATVFSAAACVFFASFHPAYALIAAAGYVCVGAVIPVCTSKAGKDRGNAFREQSGALGSFVLETLRGLPEIIQFGFADARLKRLNAITEELSGCQKLMRRTAGAGGAVTGAAILLFDILMLAAAVYLYTEKAVSVAGLLLPCTAFLSSFGPVTALANLGGTLQNTFGAARRVLSILEEEPVTDEITGQPSAVFSGAETKNVTFSYGGETILRGISAVFPRGKITGITGKSGSGKSTLLKLLMRFWECGEGSVLISDRNINSVNTKDLRNMEGFVTQETYLFHDTIENNLKIAKPSASRDEIVSACRRAAIHEFIERLPDGYGTIVGESGGTLSSGEKQRIGLARVFLHDAPFILLDEPTSNLDSLSEGIILKSVIAEQEERKKTVVLVSHRRSTMRLADTLYTVEGERNS